MKIELLYVDGCSNVERARILLTEAVQEQGIPNAIEETIISSDEMAKRLNFPGTPTIRIDGIDVEKAARGKVVVSLKPRLYIRAGMITGCPTRGAILDAILEAKDRARPA
ncbi:MAG: DUF2703 domain-containing protein [Planctomycetes bacterium]|nr:DUF2703 domain-containing protein [Planctomycetota bacterium]MBI3843862.1 DUF2703 domain-containing protein [Planctomycetota bacterium]